MVKKLIEPSWFILNDRQLELYKKLYKIICVDNKYWYSTYSGIYSDDLIVFISLIKYINRFKNADEMKKTGYDKLPEYFNAYVCSALQERYLEMSNKSYADMYFNDGYGFSDDIILEACERTIEHTHTASFPYADKILFGWAENKVTSMDDINKLDKLHSEDNQKKYSNKSPEKKVARPKNAKKFEERDYDYSKLEEQLRISRDKKFRAMLSDNK